MLQSVSITVRGIVQGVYFRQSTKEMALRSGITGEVRNLADGDVLVIATGTEPQLKKLIEWCHKGPETAVISNVIVKDVELKKFDTFKIVK